MVRDLLGVVVQALRYIGGCRLAKILVKILDGLANIVSVLGRGANCRCPSDADKDCESCGDANKPDDEKDSNTREPDREKAGHRG